MQKKSFMWNYSQDPQHAEFRELHAAEIKNFPRLRNLLQFGWAATSFGVVVAIFSQTTGSVVIPQWITITLAIAFLGAAHSLMNITYVTAIKRRLAGKTSSYYFIFPSLLMLLLFITDWKGAKELVGNYSYKASIKDVDNDFYKKRSDEIRNQFESDLAAVEKRIKSEISNATAWEQREIKRFSAMPQTDWTRKKTNEFYASIAYESAKIEKKYAKHLSRIHTVKDTTLSRIHAERSNETNLLNRINIASLDKEQEGNRSSNSIGWAISLFFLISYVVITYRIEYCRKEGGIFKDESLTPLEAYGGLFGYAYTIFKTTLLGKAVEKINKISGNTDNTINLKEVAQSFMLNTTATNATQLATSSAKPIGFKNYDDTAVQNVQSTQNVQNVQPVQNIKGVQTTNYTLSSEEFDAQLQDAKEYVMRYVRFLRRGERRTDTTHNNIKKGLAHVLSFCKKTQDKTIISEIMVWVAEIREEVGYE